jgi:hypothetical protein
MQRKGGQAQPAAKPTQAQPQGPQAQAPAQTHGQPVAAR